MGNECCSSNIGSIPRPFLKVSIGTLTNVSTAMDSSHNTNTFKDGSNNLPAFIELRYGTLRGTRNDIIEKTSTIAPTLDSKNCYKYVFNEDILLPIVSKDTLYSLEISLWFDSGSSINSNNSNNSNINGGGIVTSDNHFKHKIGQCTIYYNKHPTNPNAIKTGEIDDTIKKELLFKENENIENIKYFLPIEWNNMVEYNNIELLNNDIYNSIKEHNKFENKEIKRHLKTKNINNEHNVGNIVCGKLNLKCEFIEPVRASKENQSIKAEARQIRYSNFHQNGMTEGYNL